MEIKIERVDSREIKGDSSDVITTYAVRENGKEFRVTCRSCHDRRTLGIVGKEGSLYIETEDNTVRRQTVALGGGCGLLIDEEPVEGLSPLALRGVLMADQGKNTKEVTITRGRSDSTSSRPLVLIDDIAGDLKECF